MQVREALIFDPMKFIVIAELGAVFVGFVSIFLAFTQANGIFTEIDKFRARVIIFSSFMVVLAALVPVVLHGLKLPSVLVWQIAAGICVFIASITAFDAIRRQRKLRTEDISRTTKWFQIVTRVLAALTFASAIPIFAAYNQPGFYFLMLVSTLTVAGLTFVSFAIHRLVD